MQKWIFNQGIQTACLGDYPLIRVISLLCLSSLELAALSVLIQQCTRKVVRIAKTPEYNALDLLVT